MATQDWASLSGESLAADREVSASSSAGRPRPTCEAAAVPHCNVHVCLDSIEPTATLEYRSGEGESLVGWEQASRGNNSHYGVISSVFQYLLRLLKAGPSARL